MMMQTVGIIKKARKLSILHMFPLTSLTHLIYDWFEMAWQFELEIA